MSLDGIVLKAGLRAHDKLLRPLQAQSENTHTNVCRPPHNTIPLQQYQYCRTGDPPYPINSPTIYTNNRTPNRTRIRRAVRSAACCAPWRINPTTAIAFFTKCRDFRWSNEYARMDAEEAVWCRKQKVIPLCEDDELDRGCFDPTRRNWSFFWVFEGMRSNGRNRRSRSCKHCCISRSLESIVNQD
ncbi:hypothetical protein R3P38DRAFT_3296744 [Favolaschia claudopus]|uniref:Uncharacterized protein n=1 Tax=Favolaschia claudopus TaxID=2862362 RepID=A0AAV9Z8N2_9AGAR